MHEICKGRLNWTDMFAETCQNVVQVLQKGYLTVMGAPPKLGFSHGPIQCGGFAAAVTVHSVKKVHSSHITLMTMMTARLLCINVNRYLIFVSVLPKRHENGLASYVRRQALTLYDTWNPLLQCL